MIAFFCRFVCINDDLKFNGRCSQMKTIEANSLLMARNGVCFIGDWLALKPASLKYLQSGILLLSFLFWLLRFYECKHKRLLLLIFLVIDSGRVTADPKSNIEYALKCMVWMYWSCSAKKMRQNQTDLSIISK